MSKNYVKYFKNTLFILSIFCISLFFNITKIDAQESVQNIEIENATLSPEFNSNAYTYGVHLPAGTTEITQDLVTDTRFMTTDCGDVISTVQTADTEDLFIQIQSIFNATISDMTSDFETWFNHIKDHLSEDSAGALQNEIDSIVADVEVIQGNILDFEVLRTVDIESEV